MLCENLNSAHRVLRPLEIGTFMCTEAALMIPPGAVLILQIALHERIPVPSAQRAFSRRQA
jgi:hypothetical protein